VISVPIPPNRSAADPAAGIKNVKGILVFADISGFTKISEKLGDLGKAGTEELTALLNRYFRAMLTIVREYRGDVAKFVGDALLLKFGPETDALSCARAMMDAMRGFRRIRTSAGVYSLSMKIVIARGAWKEFLVGDRRKSEMFMTGRLVKELARIEDSARSGAIVDFALPDDAGMMPAGRSPAEGKNGAAAVPRVEGNRTGEHRSIVALFVHLDGYGENDPDWEKLQSAFTDIIDIVDMHEGMIHDIDNVAAIGSRVLIIFGAPVTHGDDGKRAVLAGLQIRDQLSRYPGIRVKVGINQGFGFAGIVGNEWRRQYAVIGDAVNTAARLTGTAAWKQVAASENVNRITSQWVDYREIPALRVKGKKRPLKRFIPLRIKAGTAYRYNFVGRDQELRTILGAMELGRKIVTVTGEAGIGKSRLVDEAAGKLKARKYAILKGETDSIKPAYYLFTSLIGRAALIRDDDPSEVKKDKLFRHITGLKKRHRPELFKENLLRRLPLLGKMLFGLDYSDPLYEQLNPKLRRENLLDAIRYYIEYQSEPAAVIFDDLNLAKEEDRAALAYLIRVLITLSPKKIGFMLVQRPGAAPVPLDPGLEVKRLELGMMDGTGINRLVTEILGGLPMDPGLDNFIKNKAEGNPFFIEQFLLYLTEKGFIKVESGHWVKTAKFREEGASENVFSMIMARVDRLEESAKETLRVASVVGREFKEKLIERVMDRPVNVFLNRTTDERLTYLRDVTELDYVFSHVMIKDVVYDSILRQRRASIHRSVAEIMEDIYALKLSDFYGILAYHNSRAENWGKALEYSVRAGEKAKDEYANDEAVNYYKNALAILRRGPVMKKNRFQTGTISEALGDIYMLEGEYSTALGYFRALRQIAAGDRLLQARALRKTAQVMHHKGEYVRALGVLDQAARSVGSRTLGGEHEKAEIKVLRCRLYKIKGQIDRALREGREGLKIAERLAQARDRTRRSAAEGIKWANKIRVNGYNNLAKIFEDRGDYAKAIVHYRRSLEISEAIGDKPGMVVTVIGMGMVFFYQGDLTRAITSYQQGMKTAEAIGDKRGMGMAAGNLGIVYATQGDTLRAISQFRQYLVIAEQIGEKQGVARTLGNIGNVYYFQGECRKAFEHYKRSLAIYETTGEKQGIATACTNLGLVSYDLGEFDRAVEYYQRSLRISEGIGEKQGVATVCSNLGLIYYDRGDNDRAIRLYNRSLKINRVIGEKSGWAVCLGNIGMAHWAKGDYAKALDFLGKGLKIAEGIGFKNEISIIKWHMAMVHIDRGELELAEKNLLDAKAILETIDDRRTIVELLLTLADLSVKKDKKYRSAVKYARQALAIAQNLNAVSVIPDCLLTLGKLSGPTGSRRKAHGYFNRAIKINAALGKKRRLADTYAEYGRMLLSGSEPERAALCLAKARAIYREFNLDHKIKELKELARKKE